MRRSGRCRGRVRIAAGAGVRATICTYADLPRPRPHRRCHRTAPSPLVRAHVSRGLRLLLGPGALARRTPGLGLDRRDGGRPDLLLRHRRHRRRPAGLHALLRVRPDPGQSAEPFQGLGGRHVLPRGPDRGHRGDGPVRASAGAAFFPGGRLHSPAGPDRAAVRAHRQLHQWGAVGAPHGPALGGATALCPVPGSLCGSGPGRAPEPGGASVPALRGGPGGLGTVPDPVDLLQPPAAADGGVRALPVAVWLFPVPDRVRPHPGCPVRLSRLWLAHHGAGSVHPHDFVRRAVFGARLPAPFYQGR